MFIHQLSRFGHRFLEIDVWAWMPYIAGFFMFIQRYVYSDWDFLASLLILMALDLFTGILKAVKKGNAVMSFGIRHTVNKSIQYFVFLILIHVMITFRVNGETIGLLGYADEGGYTFLIVIEAKSILENLQVIDDRLDFSGLTDRLKALIPKKKDE